jgi:hypothetical protein
MEAMRTSVSTTTLRTPSQERERIVWKVCAWSGPLWIVGALVAVFWVGGWFPPPQEDWSLPTLVQFYTDNSVRIRLGMGAMVFIAGFYMLWTLAIARIMRRLEGGSLAPLTILNICGGFGTFFTTVLLSVLWASAAFQASIRDADPHSIQLLNDTGWIVFDLIGAPTMLQMGALGVVLLGERDAGVPQLMPRWVAYLSFLTTVSFVEVLLLLFFKSGPFNWGGAITYYYILVVFFAWLFAVSAYVLKANGQLDQLDPQS